ncbi:MAG: glycosyltransferase family 2 protein [Candidatus Roizmanbacteria bacterium]|nr:glycosyltransferase family 2 protein [Candidatus Roizmanbacteria bacterium]
MNNISVLIQTHNEDRHIRECITSAKFLSQEVVVVDMESTDRTEEIAKESGALVISFPFSHYVEPGRAFGIQQIKTDWVFILDADERITPELAAEIKRIVPHTENTYFKVPRKNMFGGVKWLRRGGWWPDEQMRLIKLSAFESWPTQIHSTPLIKGEVGHLNNAFLHYFHGNVETMVKKTLLFEDIESNLLFEANKPVTTLTFFRKFYGELGRRLFQRVGFLDGTVGIIESIYQAYSKTITYLLLYEKKNRRPIHPLS